MTGYNYTLNGNAATGEYAVPATAGDGNGNEYPSTTITIDSVTSQVESNISMYEGVELIIQDTENYAFSFILQVCVEISKQYFFSFCACRINTATSSLNSSKFSPVKEHQRV